MIGFDFEKCDSFCCKKVLSKVCFFPFRVLFFTKDMKHMILHFQLGMFVLIFFIFAIFVNFAESRPSLLSPMFFNEPCLQPCESCADPCLSKRLKDEVDMEKRRVNF